MAKLFLDAIFIYFQRTFRYVYIYIYNSSLGNPLKMGYHIHFALLKMCVIGKFRKIFFQINAKLDHRESGKSRKSS